MMFISIVLIALAESLMILPVLYLLQPARLGEEIKRERIAIVITIPLLVVKWSAWMWAGHVILTTSGWSPGWVWGVIAGMIVYLTYSSWIAFYQLHAKAKHFRQNLFR